MASSTGLDISQHKGYGKKLLQKAEEIAFIAGVGVRNYYRKQGYVHDTSNGCFQLKHLEPCRPIDITIWLLHFIFFVFYFLFL
jgi:hypothetical protein